MLTVTVTDADGREHDYSVTRPPSPGVDGTLIITTGGSGAVWARGAWQCMAWKPTEEE